MLSNRGPKGFWESFYQLPLNQIPWQKTQADWFKELVDAGKLQGRRALDLGCGTGQKAIYLAKEGGFEEVVGVDISARAVLCAKENAKKAGVSERCHFVQGDLTLPWSFLHPEERFDLILDWATLHCLPKSSWKGYAAQVAQHCRSGGLLLIRVFHDPKGRKYFLEKLGDIKARVYFFDLLELQNLFKGFKLLSWHTSFPRTKPYQFIEALFKKY